MMHSSPPNGRRLRRLGFACAAALWLTAGHADEGNRFCGGAMQPASPDDLDHAVGELSLQYAASQPAGPVSCAAGYLLSKCGDHETANKVFDKCIAAGYTGALIWKALMYENGHGVPQDPARAADMLHRAALSGDPYYGPLGKMHYATALYQGRGVERNVEEAMRWFREAADEGDESAQEFLRTGQHTAVRDDSGRGVGNPAGEGVAAGERTDLALADLHLDLARAEESPAATAQPRRLHADASAVAVPVAPPVAVWPPVSTDAPAPVAKSGQRLVEVQPSSSAFPVVDAFGVLALVAAFLVGAATRLRRGVPARLRPARPVALHRAA